MFVKHQRLRTQYQTTTHQSLIHHPFTGIFTGTFFGTFFRNDVSYHPYRTPIHSRVSYFLSHHQTGSLAGAPSSSFERRLEFRKSRLN